MCVALICPKIIFDKHLQDPKKRGLCELYGFWCPCQLRINTLCVAKNYFLKTTLGPEGINEDVPAISFAGLHTFTSPIRNSNSLYMSYAATPRILHPAEPVRSAHKQKSTEYELVASP